MEGRKNQLLLEWILREEENLNAKPAEECDDPLLTLRFRALVRYFLDRNQAWVRRKDFYKVDRKKFPDGLEGHEELESYLSRWFILSDRVETDVSRNLVDKVKKLLGEYWYVFIKPVNWMDTHCTLECIDRDNQDARITADIEAVLKAEAAAQALADRSKEDLEENEMVVDTGVFKTLREKHIRTGRRKDVRRKMRK